MVNMKVPTIALCASVLAMSLPAIGQAQNARPLGSGPGIAAFCNKLFPNNLEAFVACVEEQAVTVRPMIRERSAPTARYRGLSQMGVLCPSPGRWPVLIELRPGGPAVGCESRAGARVREYRYED
jgi:hypothetical protein